MKAEKSMALSKIWGGDTCLNAEKENVVAKLGKQQLLVLEDSQGELNKIREEGRTGFARKWRGEVTKALYTCVSKCKTDKIKKMPEKIHFI
jgi:hypothetical protein